MEWLILGYLVVIGIGMIQEVSGPVHTSSSVSQEDCQHFTMNNSSLNSTVEVDPRNSSSWISAFNYSNPG